MKKDTSFSKEESFGPACLSSGLALQHLNGHGTRVSCAREGPLTAQVIGGAWEPLSQQDSRDNSHLGVLIEKLSLWPSLQAAGVHTYFTTPAVRIEVNWPALVAITKLHEHSGFKQYKFVI